MSMFKLTVLKVSIQFHFFQNMVISKLSAGLLTRLLSLRYLFSISSFSHLSVFHVISSTLELIDYLSKQTNRPNNLYWAKICSSQLHYMPMSLWRGAQRPCRNIIMDEDNSSWAMRETCCLFRCY